MFNKANLGIASLFIGLAVLGSLQGLRVHHYRESGAFYDWIRAASTAERNGWDDLSSSDPTKKYVDSELLAAIEKKVDNDLPPVEDSEDKGEAVSRLAVHTNNIEMNKTIFSLVSSSKLGSERSEFIDYARQRELYYARDIEYADMLYGEVGIFQMFLGFRKVAANFIWLEVDRLWHQGVVHRMIPLMKTCVLLDPQFVDAYLLGAWHLAYNVTAKMQETPYREREWSDRFQACIGEKNQYYYFGVDFLRDGISHNQHDYRLYFDLGFGIYNEKLQDYPNAVKYLSQAVRQRHDIWVPRQLYICMEKNGQYNEALHGWEDYANRFPDTTTGQDVAPRMIQRNKALIYEEEYHKLLAEAEAGGPGAEEKRAKAMEFLKQAKDIWQNIIEPFAQSRLWRLEAEDMEKEERYMEAVAWLDRARYEDLSDDNWNYCSDKIIEIKQKGGIPLTLSERKAVVRQAESDRCKGQPLDAQPRIKTAG